MQIRQRRRMYALPSTGALTPTFVGAHRQIEIESKRFNRRFQPERRRERVDGEVNVLAPDKAACSEREN